MDLIELFSRDYRIIACYQGVDIFHHLREPSREEYLAYRRRIANVGVSRSGELKHTNEAMEAPLILYDQICQKVEVQDGDLLQEVPDFKEHIPNDLKIAVIGAWNGRFDIPVKLVRATSRTTNDGEETNIEH